MPDFSDVLCITTGTKECCLQFHPNSRAFFVGRGGGRAESVCSTEEDTEIIDSMYDS